MSTATTEDYIRAESNKKQNRTEHTRAKERAEERRTAQNIAWQKRAEEKSTERSTAEKERNFTVNSKSEKNKRHCAPVTTIMV